MRGRPETVCRIRIAAAPQPLLLEIRRKISACSEKSVVAVVMSGRMQVRGQLNRAER